MEDVEVEVSSEWHSRIIQSFSCLVYCKVLFFYIFHYTLVYKLILFIFLICGETEKFESIFSAKKKNIKLWLKMLLDISVGESQKRLVVNYFLLLSMHMMMSINYNIII